MFEERRKEETYKFKVPSVPQLHGRQVSKWDKFCGMITIQDRKDFSVLEAKLAFIH